MTRIKPLFQRASEDKFRLIAFAVIGLLAFQFLRGCIPGLNGSRLPPAVEESITNAYRVCISPNDAPIWPGEARQPECGSVDIRTVGEGVVPADALASGITRAVCYTVKVDNPAWTTQGTTRHELRWHARAAGKVAVLQNDIWQTFPDQYDLDAQRWATYGCPGQYENTVNEEQ